MAISEERQLYIRCLSNDEWVDPSKSEEELDAEEEKWDREREAFVRAHDNPEELHHFVETANWGFRKEDLAQVLLNPHCDLATALLIYWGMQPTYFAGFASEEEVPHFQREDARRLVELQDRIEANTFKRFGVLGSHGQFMDGLHSDSRPPAKSQSHEKKTAMALQVVADLKASGQDFAASHIEADLDRFISTVMTEHPPHPAANPKSPFYPSEALLKLSKDLA